MNCTMCTASGQSIRNEFMRCPSSHDAPEFVALDLVRYDGKFALHLTADQYAEAAAIFQEWADRLMALVPNPVDELVDAAFALADLGPDPPAPATLPHAEVPGGEE